MSRDMELAFDFTDRGSLVLRVDQPSRRSRKVSVCICIGQMGRLTFARFVSLMSHCLPFRGLKYLRSGTEGPA